MQDDFERDSNYRFVAIHGSYTGTVAVRADGSGTVRGVGRAEAALRPGAPVDHSALLARIGEAAELARRDAGEEDDTTLLVARVFLGADPASGGRVAAQLFPYARVLSEPEATAALSSGTLGGPGVVVLAGFGASAFGRCPAGREVSVGGWGWPIGDEGSAFWMACEALRAASKAADGRAETTRLTGVLLRHCGAPNMAGLQERFARGGIDVAALANTVDGIACIAEDGDSVAARIVRYTGHELGHLASTAIRRLGMADTSCSVVLSGGLFDSQMLFNAFSQVVHQAAPSANLTRPQLPVVLGGLALAYEDMSIPISPPRFANLTAAADRAREIGAP